METLSIGQLASAVGMGVETIRFYERQGLIEEPPRRPSGYRQYPPDAIRRLRFIGRAKALGFTLKDIGQLLSLRADPSTERVAIRESARQQLDRVEAKIRDLGAMRRELSSLIDSCDGKGSVEGCPILAAMDDVEDDCSEEPGVERAV